METNKFEIIILGCGLSGMIMALSLAKNNIPSLIIEAKSCQDIGFFDNDIRTTALNSYSKKYFKKIDIWKICRAYCGKVKDIYVVDNKSSEMLHFESNAQNNETMGYIIENSVFKKCLYEAASINKNITIWDNKQYTYIENNSDTCTITLNDKSLLKCKLLMACDGKNSYAKNLFFTNDIMQDYKQTALTFIVKHELDHQEHAVEHFMKNGPFAILPLKDNFKSSIVWTLTKNHAEVVTKLPIEEFTYLVQDNFGDFLGRIEIISKIASFPLASYATKKYFNKSIVLIADTAHIIHPLAGQGLNQGIKDIECLGSLIGKRGINIKTLIDYQKYRQSDNENMMLITDVINKVFTLDSKILCRIRQVGFKIIENSSYVKQKLVSYASGKR